MGKNYSQKSKIENLIKNYSKKSNPPKISEKTSKNQHLRQKHSFLGAPAAQIFPENGQKLLAKSQKLLAKGSKIICQISEFENLGQKLFFGMVNNYLQMGKN